MSVGRLPPAPVLSIHAGTALHVPLALCPFPHFTLCA